MARTNQSPFTPDPAKRFYQLDENLLRDGNLRPLAKLILIDFFHRERKGENVTSIAARCEMFFVSHDVFAKSERELVRDGYLLVKERPGYHHLYSSAYPPIPEGHERREAFVRHFEEFCASMDPTQKQEGRSNLPYAKSGGSPTLNPEGPHISLSNNFNTEAIEEEEVEIPEEELTDHQRFSAYRKYLHDYFRRKPKPYEWDNVEGTICYWRDQGLPPLPVKTFHRYCIEERDRIEAKGEGVPRYSKPLEERIANEGAKFLRSQER